MGATVAVIGAGDIGSRHVQALARLRGDVRLYVTDPSSEALARARQRYEEVTGATTPGRVTYLQDMEELPGALDVAIVATTADVRARVTTTLLTGRRVRYLVLEKVLFQRLEEYRAVGLLLKQQRVPAWVNLYRADLPAYRPIADAIRTATWIDYQVTGSSWGLGCNGVHFLAHVARLADCETVDVDTAGLDPGTVPARRPGFREFTGRVVGRCGRASFSLTSKVGGTVPPQISIDSDLARFVIREHRSSLRLWTAGPESEWLFEPSVSDLPPQSGRTQEIVSDLLERGGCQLTPYEQGAALHVTFIKALLHHVNTAGGPGVDACPIT